MQIQCPNCRSRATLPDHKEGAKVRCGECGRVYAAYAPGARRASSGSPGIGLILGVVAGAAALGLAIFLATGSGKKKEPGTTRAAAAPAAEPEAIEDTSGFGAQVVQVAARLHEAVFTYDEKAVRDQLFGARIWAAERAAEADPESDVPPLAPAEFFLEDDVARDAHYRRWVEDLVRGEGRELVGEWEPYDGEVVELSDDEALVRLALAPRAAGYEKRQIEWRLAKDAGQWKVFAWERYFSPEELAAMERKRKKGYERVELSDGSQVLERQPEPLEHLEDTPQELRERIDSLYATLIDLDLTKEAAAAMRELVEIGRPAIPVLLTGLYETPLESEAQAIQANLIVQTLRNITGESFGYKPQVALGSGVGTTEERRQSAIKQWFAWWYRKQNVFTEKQSEDGLEGLIELTEKEKRWLERNKD